MMKKKTYIWTIAKFSLEARKIAQGCVFKVRRKKKKKQLCVADGTLHGDDKYMCTCTGQEMFLGIRQFSSIHLKVVKEKYLIFFSCIGLTHNPRKSRYKLGKQLTFNMVNSTFLLWPGKEKINLLQHTFCEEKSHNKSLYWKASKLCLNGNHIKSRISKY